ncbi:hypothetical protein HAX54_018947, partial [Datura stramonium]|nr:hypothetical protein [Datura stramonium]
PVPDAKLDLDVRPRLDLNLGPRTRPRSRLWPRHLASTRDSRPVTLDSTLSLTLSVDLDRVTVRLGVMSQVKIRSRIRSVAGKFPSWDRGWGQVTKLGPRLRSGLKWGPGSRFDPKE